ncbi:LIC12162 family protein [Thiothrix litoralis]|uniref:LIC12162 family protein n=1 Tax=Thiothrix litoralis TaxID=2891210 RepID=A0ABX7WVY8_9GAMM|nr:LIC12162 family protein [Thiothrix litoralis]QTR46433.1 LIC12162 family protein [Thiothrix litoralis]
MKKTLTKELDNNIPRYLITTSDEQTWKFDRPVVFLGEWCLLHSRKHIWQEMDAVVAPSYGLEPTQKDADYAEAKSLEQKILPKLSEILNKHHNKQYSQRSWKIILGHWLRRYINVIINRTKSLEQCFQHYDISGTTTYNKNSYTLAVSDSYTAIWAFNDGHWNNILIAEILDLLEKKDISTDQIEINSGKNYFSFKKAASYDLSPVKKHALSLYKKTTKLTEKYLTKKSDAVIINSYLPHKEVIKLQLVLSQFPQLWKSSPITIASKVDNLLRESLSKKLIIQSDNTTEGIVQSLLFKLLPTCYLEGFKELESITHQQLWPKYPKFIFTSNNFDTDEVFKLWTAQKTESGTLYITGQHGNNYGTYRYMNPSIEEETADKFLTWGWTDGLPQHIPTFIFKTANQKKASYNPQGGLLLIELCETHRITTWDSTEEFKYYFDNQLLFISTLGSDIKRQTTIRLHAQYRNMNWDEEARWQAFDQSIKVDTGKTNIKKLISNSRLVVHSYDSTGILETLSSNIPTLAFWQNDFYHLRESAKPYYEKLLNAGIIHLTPQSIAIKIKEIWNNVDEWWMQSEVQDARKQFCDRYAKISHTPAIDIKKILLSSIND